MSSEGASVPSKLHGKVSTGYRRLDDALQGGLPSASATILSAAPSDEIPILLTRFLEADTEAAVLLCRNLSSAQTISGSSPDNVKSLVCSDKPISPSANTLPGKGIENLTELNFRINEVLDFVKPKRLVLEILSDILLRHKALQTRKWLNELLERLRSRGVTTLAVLNPYMHAAEEVQAVLDIFDGALEILEGQEGTLGKLLNIKWMHGCEVAEKTFILDLSAEAASAISPQPVAPAAPFEEPRWATPLISRAAEVSKLKEAFNSSLAGKRTLVALHGETGAGKTRLLHESAVYAQSKNGVVLTGSSSEDKVPYRPWVQVCRQYVAQASSEVLRKMLRTHASDLVRLVPDITDKLGTIPPSKPLGDQQDKIRLFEATTQFLLAISNQAPLLMLLDDLEYVDLESLDMLEYFIRGSGNQRILVVCSYASDQVRPDSPLNQTMMKFNKQRILETIAIKNLNKSETTELIKQTFGEQTVSGEFVDLIFERTGGNPFFVEEVMRSLVEDGSIFRTEKGWDRKPISELTLPESVKSALKSRLDKLPQESVSVLTMAAVIGAGFDFEVLLALAEIQDEALLEIIEKAAKAGLILEVPGPRDAFKFTDDRIKELLLEELLHTRQKRYHLKIAEAMEKVYANELQTHAEPIANHFTAAGEAERALKYSIMSGERAMSIHAYTLAISSFKRALDLVEAKEKKDEDTVQLLEKLAGAYYSAGQFQDAMKFFDRAIAINQRLGNRKACARLSVNLSLATFRGKGGYSAMPDVIQVLKRGLEYLGGEETPEAADIYVWLASRTSDLDEYGEAKKWAEKAGAVGEKTQNYSAIAAPLENKAWYLLDTGGIDEGLPLLKKAYELHVQHENYEATLDAIGNLPFYTLVKSLPEAREWAVKWIELTKQLNHIFSEANARVSLAVVDWLGGAWDSSEAEFAKAFEIAQRLDAKLGFYYGGWRPLLALGKGDLEKAERLVQGELAALGPKISNRVATNLALGKLRLVQGRVDEAKAAFEKSVEAFKKMEFTTMPLMHIETLLNLTMIEARVGNVDEAHKMSDWAMRLGNQLKSDAGLALATQAKAIFLKAQGDGEGAMAAYREALTFWEKAGWPYYKAQALEEFAGVLRERSPEESRRLLEQAFDIFRKLGTKRDPEAAKFSGLPPQR